MLPVSCHCVVLILFPGPLTWLYWVQHVTASISSCGNHATATQGLVKDVPPASWGIIHAVCRFLQSCSNVRRMTCFGWRLTHDITVHIMGLSLKKNRFEINMKKIPSVTGCHLATYPKSRSWLSQNDSKKKFTVGRFLRLIRKTTQGVVKNFKNNKNAAIEKKDWINTVWRSILCSRNGIRIQWVNFWLKSENYRIKKISCQTHENFMILNQGAVLGNPTFPIRSMLESKGSSSRHAMDQKKSK